MATKIIREPAISVPVKPVVNSTAEFRNGLCGCYLIYCEKCQGQPITDTHVYNFMNHNITDESDTDMFNAGDSTGWIEALLEDRRILYSLASREVEGR